MFARKADGKKSAAEFQSMFIRVDAYLIPQGVIRFMHEGRNSLVAFFRSSDPSAMGQRTFGKCCEVITQRFEACMHIGMVEIDIGH